MPEHRRKRNQTVVSPLRTNSRKIRSSRVVTSRNPIRHPVRRRHPMDSHPTIHHQIPNPRVPILPMIGRIRNRGTIRRRPRIRIPSDPISPRRGQISHHQMHPGTPRRRGLRSPPTNHPARPSRRRHQEARGINRRLLRRRMPIKHHRRMKAAVSLPQPIMNHSVSRQMVNRMLPLPL